MTKEITTQNKSSIGIGSFQGSRSIILNSLSEIHTFATMVCKTDLVPKGYRGKPEDATVAIIYGMEIGLPPLASLQNISVVNGTPTVWGDAQLSLVQSSGKYEYHKATYEGEYPKDDFKAVFEIKRIGAKEAVIKEFSVAQAKKAGLWGKAGTWTSHDKTMLLYKAKAFALREGFADVLKGMHSAEEMEGEVIIESKDVTPSHEPLKNIASNNWAEDIKKDFPNAYKDYESLQELFYSCETLSDLENFEKNNRKDLNFLEKNNQEDHKKLYALIEDHRAELKGLSELNNQN